MLVMIGNTITHIRPNQVIESSEELHYSQLKDITPKKPKTRTKKNNGSDSDS